jgi:hypothetical protein
MSDIVKVYLVNFGDVNLAVFSSREKADAYIEQEPEVLREYYCIEEFELQ